MIDRVNHVSFTVENLEPMIEFYCSVFGLGPADVGPRDRAFTETITGLPGAAITVAYLPGPNTAVELIKYTGAEGEPVHCLTNNPGSAHVGLNVVDFKAVLEKALAAGATMRGAPARVEAGPNAGMTVVYIQDPEGNSIELLSARPPAGA